MSEQSRFLIYLVEEVEKKLKLLRLEWPWPPVNIEVGDPKSKLPLRELRREPLLDPVVDPGAEETL